MLSTKENKYRRPSIVGRPHWRPQNATVASTIMGVTCSVIAVVWDVESAGDRLNTLVGCGEMRG
ncbi:Hypothetical predicted protein [Olea europaea subsp. europaea]|uniref:Uncharacterized protein n=1 Tax=Olea europaea subsp. europaea TaxID=158383 RepID=A0A8S0UQR2_OLEEU|nr:Hypothetical predicted protein [Olea europaea subsp. europaea]